MHNFFSRTPLLLLIQGKLGLGFVQSLIVDKYWSLNPHLWLHSHNHILPQNLVCWLFFQFKRCNFDPTFVFCGAYRTLQKVGTLVNENFMLQLVCALQYFCNWPSLKSPFLCSVFMLWTHHFLMLFWCELHIFYGLPNKVTFFTNADFSQQEIKNIIMWLKIFINDSLKTKKQRKLWYQTYWVQ